MLFASIVLLTGLVISSISAYYSIIGLTAIFAAAFWPIVIMGGVLEIGKIVSTVWLHLNWHRASWKYKAYLVPAVVTLMFITSMGIFGFLSKAHMDQGIVSGDSQAKLMLIDEKIKTQRDNVEVARKALTQMDAQVDARLSRGDSEQGAERAVQIRRQQAGERTKLQKEIGDAQKIIAKLNEERAPIAAENRKIEAEVGPIKYIAALIYGDNPDTNLLEKAVRWVIIIIVLVFDPLAIVLILAATMSFEWARQDKKKKLLEQQNQNTLPTTLTIDPEIAVEEKKESIESANQQSYSDNIDDVNKILKDLETDIEQKYEVVIETQAENIVTAPPVVETVDIVNSTDPVTEEQNQKKELISDLVDQLKAEKEKKEQQETNSIIETAEVEPVTIVAQAEPIVVSESVAVKEAEPMPVKHQAVIQPVPETALRYKEPTSAVPQTVAHLEPIADNKPSAPTNTSGFGIEFPVNPMPIKNDTFLRVDTIPNRLYKFDGVKWIETERTIDVSLLDNQNYIAFLADQVNLGKYDLQNLPVEEQEKVNSYLNSK